MNTLQKTTWPSKSRVFLDQHTDTCHVSAAVTQRLDAVPRLLSSTSATTTYAPHTFVHGRTTSTSAS